MKLIPLSIGLQSLTVFRPLLDTPILSLQRRLLDDLCQSRGREALEDYTQLVHTLWSEGYSGLVSWLWDQLRYTETPYSRLVEQGGSNPALTHAARREVELLLQLCETDGHSYLDALIPCLSPDFAPVLSTLPRWQSEAPFSFETLTQVYETQGAGIYARYRAFVWEEGQLIPVPDPDCPKPFELLGYQHQRQQVLHNTRLLLEGQRANNVLLFGEGGTGKSATVKSMLHLPGMEALRLIEIQKENLAGMPRLIRSLSGRRQRFILFIDDLAFDQDDKTYSSLKSILEGGLEPRPSNVAIYATSNRRHLVRQNFQDRDGDEVDTFETIAEKTALAERFGLRIPYMTMGKADYLTLVDHLAQQCALKMDAQLLHAKAMEWEIRHAGRTPRVAHQFITSLAHPETEPQ